MEGEPIVLPWGEVPGAQFPARFQVPEHRPFLRREGESSAVRAEGEARVIDEIALGDLKDPEESAGVMVPDRDVPVVRDGRDEVPIRREADVFDLAFEPAKNLDAAARFQFPDEDLGLSAD